MKINTKDQDEDEDGGRLRHLVRGVVLAIQRSVLLFTGLGFNSRVLSVLSHARRELRAMSMDDGTRERYAAMSCACTPRTPRCC